MQRTHRIVTTMLAALLAMGLMVGPAAALPLLGDDRSSSGSIGDFIGDISIDDLLDLSVEDLVETVTDVEGVGVVDLDDTVSDVLNDADVLGDNELELLTDVVSDVGNVDVGDVELITGNEISDVVSGTDVLRNALDVGDIDVSDVIAIGDIGNGDFVIIVQ